MSHPDAGRRAASYADLAALPPHVVGEIVSGELHATPRPSPRHAAAASGLGGSLHGPFDRGRGGPGGWVILFEPELHVGADVLVPDLTRCRRDRMRALPDEAWVSIAPDWGRPRARSRRPPG